MMGFSFWITFSDFTEEWLSAIGYRLSEEWLSAIGFRLSEEWLSAVGRMASLPIADGFFASLPLCLFADCLFADC